MAREWVRAGHDVEVLCPVPNHPMGVIPPEYRGRVLCREVDPFGVVVTRFWIYAAANRGKFRRSFKFASSAVCSAFVGTLLSARPDVIIGSSPQLLAALAGCTIAHMRGVPWIFEVRDLWPESIVSVGLMAGSHPLVRGLHRVADSLYDDAARVVVVTRSFARVLRERGVEERRLAFIPNGVDLTRFVPAPPSPKDRMELGGKARFIVSYIGTHGMAHDLGRLLDVAHRMRDREDVAFAFVGDGAERASLEARAKQERLERVRFLGVQPRERMPQLYAASDLSVVSLLKDDVLSTCLPSKMFEIMGMARPIVISVDGEARQIVEESGAGRFALPGDSGALHDAIERLLANPDDLERCGARGREYVVRNFDRAVLARQYLDVLVDAVNGGTRHL